MGVLDSIITDILAQEPDHVALTGDLANIGMPAEFALAKRSLLRLGGPDYVSIIPGNHDAYVHGSLTAMRHIWNAHMSGDNGSEEYPYLRSRGPLALIGLSSAVPSLPFLATGRLGRDQLDRFEHMLLQARKTHAATVVMIHHPPHVGGARCARNLTDAKALEGILQRIGADLVIHGHNHRLSIARLTGADGNEIPVVGVASASAVPGSLAHRAAYHMFTFDRKNGKLDIGLEVRGIAETGAPVTTLETIPISG